MGGTHTWMRWLAAILILAGFASCQGISFETRGGAGVAIESLETLSSTSSDLTFIAAATPETNYATSATITVSNAPSGWGGVRHGLVAMPAPPAGLDSGDFIRSARIQFNVVSCSNTPPEVEVRRAPLGTNAATGAESRFALMTANWLCSTDAAVGTACESGAAGATWTALTRNPVLGRRSCPNGTSGTLVAFDITGDFVATFAAGGVAALSAHPGYLLSLPAGISTTTTLPSDVTLVVDTEAAASFVPVLPTVPALDRSKPTHVLDAYGFMLGTVMFGGAVDEVRAAHLRGRVRALSGSVVVDLAAADVRVLDRPDAPITRSRNDAGNVGAWDLLVNGGAPVTLSFSAPGYVTLQRVVDVGWNDEVTVPDVVLVPEPACVAVNGVTGGLYTHPSWSVTDGRGTRSVVAYIPPNTEVRTSSNPGSGSSSFDLCWTEMTRRVSGVRDDAFMPADVATSTAYTFAGEGRVRVNSTSPFLIQPYFAPAGGPASARSSIVMYLRTDTFVGTSGGPSNLDLPVGTTVPVGAYHERRGLWGPEPDGTYVGVSSASSNCISVGGAPVTVPTPELTAVCNATSTFPDNSRYMRVPISHFSPTDWNLLGALANFLENIQMDEPSPGVCEITQNASIIYCERRALGERIPVHGTPFELSYNSANQAGRTEAYSARVTAGGTGPVPATVNLSMEVAGRTVATASVGLGGTATLTWDGNDAFGRRMLGPQRADIWVEYVFSTEFLCQNPSAPGRSFQDRLAGFTVNCGAREARLRYRRTRWVGNFDDRIRGMGGWAISDHHIYDPVTRVLSMGTGEMRTEATTGWVASADTTSFPGRWGIASAAAADGAVYLVTSGTGGTIGNQIHRYSASGALDATTITVFSDVTALAVGPEGEVYVGREGPSGTSDDGCIMRLRSWTNSTAAFEPLIGTCGTASTSVPAARAPLVCEACGTPASGPNQVATARVHVPTNMAVSPDGMLYYTDLQSSSQHHSILFFRTVSGNRILSLFRRQADIRLGPIVFDRQSRMYWSTRTGNTVSDPWVVRRLDDDADPGGGGTISDGRIVVGGGSNVADGVLATGFQLAALTGLAVLPTGELVVVEGTRVRLGVRIECGGLKSHDFGLLRA